MKKLTADVAKRLSSKSDLTIKSFQDAISIIELHTTLGFTNCFIDGELKDLKVVKVELQDRGFRCFIEDVGNPENKFLTVEW